MALFVLLYLPLAHIRQTEEPEEGEQEIVPSHGKVAPFCPMFLRQVGQDNFGLQTRALKQLNQSIHFTRPEGNRMERESHKQEMATSSKLLLIGKDWS